jgi:hypothetical protein
MANRAVTLYLRIKTPEGKKPYCKPVFLAKGRLKPLYAFVDGEPEHRPEGVYYMRFGADSGKQQMVPLGNDPYLALDKVAEKERWLRDRERGMVTPIAPHQPSIVRLQQIGRRAHITHPRIEPEVVVVGLKDHWHSVMDR